MIRMGLLASFVLASAAYGQQLQFAVFNGTADTVITANSYVVAPTPIGAKSVTRIHVKNIGTASVSIPRIALSGQGFTITSTPLLPYTLASGNQIEVQVTFAPTSSGSYSANLGINTASLVLIGSSTAAAATLTTAVRGAAVSALDFGNVAANATATIVAYVENHGTAPITVNQIQIAGSGFSLTTIPPLPLTLLPTQSSELDLQFAATAGASTTYSGTLSIDSQTYPLTVKIYQPVFPALTVTVPASATSQSQLPLTIDLPSPAPYSATGYVQVDFKPASGLQDDPAILFLSSSRRTMNFTFNSGDTQATFTGDKTTSFQTGTTAGTLTFTAVLQTATVKATTNIAPAPLAICATLSKPNSFQVSLTVSGYDNTRSASQMAFTFYACSSFIKDQFGNPVCQANSAQVMVAPGQIAYDATRDFSQYFAQSTAGGAFTLLAQFPISGTNTATIDSVALSFTNSVGTGTIASIPLSGLNACTGYTKGP